ncbi:MAG: FMN-binding protein [Ilumatobacteraceae bacterium]
MSTQPLSKSAGDPLLERLERLERLNQRRDGNAGRSPASGSLSPPPPPAQTRHAKRHPARIARLGALAISCATTGGLTYLFADLNASKSANQALAALPAVVPVGVQITSAPPTSAATPATTPAATAAGVPSATATTAAPTPSAPAATPVAAVQAFNGQLVNTEYGPVQVQLQFTNGAISEVAIVAYPTGDKKSVRINARALPTLRSEVLSAQSAQIDTVSGATYTSDAYVRSLQSAIDQARAAGATARG